MFDEKSDFKRPSDLIATVWSNLGDDGWFHRTKDIEWQPLKLVNEKEEVEDIV